MGSKTSKKNKNINLKIDDYTKLKLPKDYTLIKMASYNVDLSHTVNLDQKIKEIISYIISNFNNKVIDIINIQEINDSISLHIFIEEFKRYCLIEKLKYYFAPQYDNINPTITGNNNSHSPTSSVHMIEMSFESSGSFKNEEKKKKVIQNVIISKFPIISTIYCELDDNTDMDDILGIQTIVGANILIGNSIISVYNTNLSKDIKAAQLINTDVRNTELDSIIQIINTNIETLITDNTLDKYAKPGVHLIVGTFNISEVDLDNNINDEYNDLLSSCHLIDIYRLISEKDTGFTTTFKERINYIFLHMTEDFYKIDSEYFNIITKNNDVTVLKNTLLKRYKIHFFDYYTVENYDNLSIYFPIECVFMVSNK